MQSELPEATRCAMVQRALDLGVRLAPFRWKLSLHSILFRMDLFDGPDTKGGKHVDLDWANERDLASIATHPEGYGWEAYDRCLRRGDACYRLKLDGEIVCYNWVAFHKCCLLCGFRSGVEFLPLRSGQVFTYDLYTYLKFRNRGFGAALKRALYGALRHRGVKSAYSSVTPDRVPSIRIQIRLGAEAERVLYAFRMRQFATVFLGPKNDPRLQSWIAKQALALDGTSGRSE